MPFPVDEGRIKAAEEALGRGLPPGLRERLARANGGAIEADGIVWELYTVYDDSDRRRLRATATSHLVHENEQNQEMLGDLLPDGAVAVAGDGSGDLLLVLAGGDDLAWWDHETGDLQPAQTDWSQDAADALLREDEEPSD